MYKQFNITKKLKNYSVTQKRLMSKILVIYLFSFPALYGIPLASVSADDSNKTEWGIGAAVQISENAYQGYDPETQILPYLFIENSWVKLAGPNLDFKLGNLAEFSFVLRSKFSFGDGYESSDADILRGMQDRADSIWVGPAMFWKNSIVDISLEALADSLGNSEGQQVVLEFSKGFRASQRIGIKPSIGVIWLSNNYVDYYYGVEAAEAGIDRPEYEGHAALVFNVGLSMTYSFDTRQMILLRTELKSFDR